MSNRDFQDDPNELNIALPDELPLPPRLATHSDELQSSTVETLITQNDDLMARLSISHRRNSHSERRIRELACENNELQKRLEVLGDQLLIHREKDRAVFDRQSALEKTIEDLNSQLEFQSIRYAELYNEKQINEKNQEELIHKFRKKATLLSRYRYRILERIAPKLKQYSKTNQDLEKRLKEVHELVAESGEYIKGQKRQIENLQLTRDKRLKEIEQHIEEKTLFQKKYLKLKEERTIHQNRVIAAERMRDELVDKYRKEIDELQSQMSDFRCRLKTSQAELTGKNEICDRQDIIIKELRTEKDKIQDQAESMQTLWSDQKKRLEQTEQRCEALNKLNQEMSHNLKVFRESRSRDSEASHGEIDKAKQTILNLQTELELLKRAQTFRESEAKVEMNEESDQSKKLAKLESLLAEIQSGYATEKWTPQLENFSFKENKTKKNNGELHEQLMSEQGDIL